MHTIVFRTTPRLIRITFCALIVSLPSISMLTSIDVLFSNMFCMAPCKVLLFWALKVDRDTWMYQTSHFRKEELFNRKKKGLPLSETMLTGMLNNHSRQIWFMGKKWTAHMVAEEGRLPMCGTSSRISREPINMLKDWEVFTWILALIGWLWRRWLIDLFYCGYANLVVGKNRWKCCMLGG